MRTLDLSVELFNQKLLNLDDSSAASAATTATASAAAETPGRRGLPGCIARFLAAAGGPEGARQPWERDDNFAFEPRSRQWQYFGRAWNEIVISLRDGDLLSDAEVANLCFRFLADEPVFGVPEYVVYPSMLTSPVFTLLVARGVFGTSYPSFARTLRQTRDLTVWLLVTLGAVRMGERQQLVTTLSELAYAEAKLRARRRRGDPGGLLHLRTAVVELLQAVLHAHEAAVEASESERESEREHEIESERDARAAAVTLTAAADAHAPFEEDPEAIDAAAATEPLARLPTLLTAVMEAVKRLFTSTEASSHLLHTRTAPAPHPAPHPARYPAPLSPRLQAAINMSESAQRVVELYRTLRGLVRIEELQGAAARRRLRDTLCTPGVEMAVGAMLASLTTTNPGGAPRNEEARRQLIFFCNSLHNRDLRRPPPVTAMRSLTSFTPYYAEDVTYALEELHGELNDNVDLLHLLQSIFPDEYANLTERMGVLGLSASREESSKFDEFELGRWASDRGQLLSRTVRGAARWSHRACRYTPVPSCTPLCTLYTLP